MSTEKQKYIEKIDKTKDKIFVYTKEDKVESKTIEFILRDEYKIKSLTHASHRLFVYNVEGVCEIPNMRFITSPVSTEAEEPPAVKKETPKRRTRRTRRKSTQDTWQLLYFM